jgi:hypothetical protein
MNKNQFDELEQSILFLKRAIFKFLNRSGLVNHKQIITFFSLEPRTSDIIKKWIYEWLGGDDYFNKLKSEILSKTFRGQAGTYDFKFEVSKISLDSDDFQIMLVANVDSNGECYIENDDGVTYTNIGIATEDEDIGWEVLSELNETIEETLRKKYQFFETFYINVTDTHFSDDI